LYKVNNSVTFREKPLGSEEFFIGCVVPI